MEKKNALNPADQDYAEIPTRYMCRVKGCKGYLTMYVTKEAWNSHFRQCHGRLGRTHLALTTRQLTDIVSQLGVAPEALIEDLARVHNLISVVVSLPFNFFDVLASLVPKFQFGFLFGPIQSGTWKVTRP